MFLEKIKTLWNFTTNALVALLEKLFTYAFKLSSLAYESCFNLSFSVSRAGRSFSEDFLTERWLAFCFLLEPLGTSSLTSSWLIISITTSWFSSNSSTKVLSLSFLFCIFVNDLLNTDPLFCRLVCFLFPLSATAGGSNSIKC